MASCLALTLSYCPFLFTCPSPQVACVGLACLCSPASTLLGDREAIAAPRQIAAVGEAWAVSTGAPLSLWSTYCLLKGPTSSGYCLSLLLLPSRHTQILIIKLLLCVWHPILFLEGETEL